ncbi:MAG TPA: TatD family hydrolase, partial [Acidimicrobiales bacterium]
MSHWTDAHCHLQEQFLGDEETTAKLLDTLSRTFEGGVDRVVVIGTDATTSAQALEITSVIGPVDIYATVGLHPHDALQDIEPVLALARHGHPKLVGIGECGLDYYYEHSPRADQRRAFATQIALAHELDLALVIHARDAFDDLFDVLSSEGVPERTVV